jgi:hypothetical protein
VHARRLDFRRITAEGAGDLLSSGIEWPAPRGLEGFGYEKTAIDRLPGLHNEFCTAPAFKLDVQGTIGLR